MTSNTKKSQRGATSKDSSVLVAVWLPRDLKLELDRRVQAEDSDRSKIIRAALRARLMRSA